MDNDSKIKIFLPFIGIAFFIIFLLILFNKFKVDRSLIGLYEYKDSNINAYIYFDTSYSYVIYLGNDKLKYRDEENVSLVYIGKYKIDGNKVILSNQYKNESMTCNSDFINEFVITKDDNLLLNSDLLSKDISFSLVNDNVRKDNIINVLDKIKSMDNCLITHF